MSMKIRIDTDSCTGHGRCYTLAPDLFAADDETGYGVVIGDGEVDADRAELVEQARRAVNNCPERAVVAEDAPSWT